MWLEYVGPRDDEFSTGRCPSDDGQKTYMVNPGHRFEVAEPDAVFLLGQVWGPKTNRVPLYKKAAIQGPETAPAESKAKAIEPEAQKK